ncbi:MAG: helix-turn-helix transcriptional regulator [Bacillota bacterium]
MEARLRDKAGNMSLNHINETAGIFYQSTLVPVMFIDRNADVILNHGMKASFLTIDKKSAAEVFEKYDISCSKTRGSVYEVSIVSGMNFYILFLPCNSPDYILAAGPILLSKVNEELLKEIMQHGGITLQNTTELRKQLENLPLIQHPRSYYIANLLRKLFLGELENQHPESLENASMFKLLPNAQYDESGRYSILQSYELEQQFLSYVRMGNTEEVKKQFKAFSTHPFPNLCTSDELRSMKNHAIVFCTLVTRAAIEGGVEAEYAMQLSDSVIQNIEKLYRIDRLYEYMQSVIVQFTESVIQLGAAAHSGIIKRAVKYVHGNISGTVTAEAAAAHVNMSPGYFGALFKKETGMSFNSYVNKSRVEKARYMIKNTELSLLDIAISCGFEDQSYFTKVFKKWTGMLPKEFRRL